MVPFSPAILWFCAIASPGCGRLFQCIHPQQWQFSCPSPSQPPAALPRHSRIRTWVPWSLPSLSRSKCHYGSTLGKHSSASGRRETSTLGSRIELAIATGHPRPICCLNSTADTHFKGSLAAGREKSVVSTIKIPHQLQPGLRGTMWICGK